jgi:hypothetical protein
MRPENLENDENAKHDLIYNYEFMQTQLSAISNTIFQARLMTEFINGNPNNNVIIAAHIRNEDQIRSWLKKDA